MPQFLSKEDHSLIINGFCPCCHGSGFILGPAQSHTLAPGEVINQNALCPKCRREYNVSRFSSQITNCVCEPERQREIYHLVETPFETP